MKITLKRLKLESWNNDEFKKLIDNSYNEWSINWQNLNKKEEKNSWKAEIELEYKNSKGTFVLDTEGDYLTYLDLEGYLSGEMFDLESGVTLKLASKSSNILVGIVYSEAIRLGLLDEDVAEDLAFEIFPEWSRGLIPNEVLEDEEVKHFYENNLKSLENKGILSRYKVEMDGVEVLCENEEVKEDFLEFIREYLEDEIFFYIQNENID